MGSAPTSLPPAWNPCGFELSILPLDAKHSRAFVAAFRVAAGDDCAWVFPGFDWRPHIFQGKDRPGVCGAYRLRDFHPSNQDWGKLLGPNWSCLELWGAEHRKRGVDWSRCQTDWTDH